LLSNRELKNCVGFISKAHKKFNAGLRLTAEWKVEFVFEDRGDVTDGKALGAPCPKCGGTVKDTGRMYACETGDFKLWKEIASRTLSESEAVDLLRVGELAKLTGFKGGKGNFDAGLKFSRDYSKVEFVFEKRQKA